MQQFGTLEEIKKYCEHTFNRTFIKWSHNQITHTQVPKQNTYHLVFYISPPHDGEEEIKSIQELKKALDAQGFKVKSYAGETEERGIHIEFIVMDKVKPLYAVGEEVLYGGNLSGPPTIFQVEKFQWSVSHKCFEYNIVSFDGLHKHLVVLEKHLSRKAE